MGGQVSNDPKECTHLLANKIIKSCKFLSAVNRGIPIVSDRWLQASSQSKYFMGNSIYPISTFLDIS